ncbi:hypothetical protein FRACYDRAFT_241701 [Fragilariopsis cylindrus CCMP1102]|uniref:Ataxin-10 domain-containing protein n=1 Tax=Fragilariopsis cylindrus CCMP1102 TaxID=635003 RepID=A0A1E7F678_9STRA|nr:hypothetical protein FRACYDRAFT_241701 [Fragilariopsis cylindrus CCMP1102]|eukprot:OEU13363.1 hypothetical protein FRACYDRAFT_241701 [Fragilariopsis cylindrus CCMP1102]
MTQSPDNPEDPSSSSSPSQPPTTAGLNWTEILQKTKNVQREFSENNSKSLDNFQTYVESKFLPCHDQFLVYAKEMSLSKSDSKLCPDKIKELVVQTRAALRFGLSYLSIYEKYSSYSSEETVDVVRAIQYTTIIEYRWYEPLVTLLSQRRGDSKCRIYAAQLMSNLVTSNVQTAVFVSSNVRISPSSESVSSSIIETISSSPVCGGGVEPNWVDMILSAAISRNREAIAAITAILHNCICSLLIKNISSNGMLISTLLRHFVSAEAVTDAIVKVDDVSGSKKEQVDDHWDSATEWIQLFLSKLAKLGMLLSMFSSINTPRCTTSTSITSTDGKCTKSTLRKLLPEQNILLHCMSREIDTYAMEYCTNNNNVQDPFGEEAAIGEPSNSSYAFLASLMIELSPWFRRQRLPKTTKTHEYDQIKEEGDDDFNQQLMLSGYITINEILGCSLGIDSPLNKILRLYLGQETIILQEAIKSLGVMLDDLAGKSVGCKSSDIHMTKDDQRLLVSLVQFVGNFCYKCRHNQDLLRMTIVPKEIESIDGYDEGSGKNSESSSDKNTNVVMRNGLHVLLSCTTHATACFTLREWGVIAIRHLLEDNSENQAVVEELMAQDTVQSAELQQAGVQVQMTPKGNFSISPIDEK